MESHEKDLRSAVESDEQRQAIQNDYRTAGLSAREVTLLDYAVKLTKDPRAVGHADLDALRNAGYTDEQLVDVGYTYALQRLEDCRTAQAPRPTANAADRQWVEP